MRIFFIPGLGEDVSIFNNIQSFIAGEKIFVDNLTLLAPLREQGLTALLYAQYLTKYLDLEKEDVIIGHSMGGWVALHIKHLVGCRIVQISSWTDSRKIINVPVERHLRYWLAKRGIDFNSFVLRILVWLHYNNKPSCKYLLQLLKG